MTKTTMNMLPDPIVVMLEEEIVRLRRVRTILESLLDGEKEQEPKTAPMRVLPEPVTVTHIPARKPRGRRVRKPAPPAESPTVLRGAIPRGPVVVRPSALKPVSVPAVEPQVGSFARLVRAAEQSLNGLT